MLAAVALAGLASFAGAETGRTPKPAITIAKPGQCVEPTAVMRRDHMKFLKHQRDLTMHEGIRTKQFSLNECVACHASPKTGSVLGEGGFCQSCHSYAAVKLDCFECHQAKPKPAMQGQAGPTNDDLLAAMQRGRSGQEPAREAAKP